MDKELQTSIKIAERSPYRLSLKVIIAGSAMSQGDLDTSYRLLMQCLTFMPEFLPAQRLMAVNRLLSKDFKLSLQEFDYLLTMNPSSKLGLMGSSMLMCHLRNSRQAIQNLLELSKLEPFEGISNELLAKLADTEMLGNSNFQTASSKILQEHKKTAHDMLDELGAGSENIRLKLVLAGQLINRGEKKTALGILTRLKDSHPNYPDLLFLLARLRNKSGNSNSANSYHQTILDIQPTFNLKEIPDGIEFRYSDEEDLPTLKELDNWCESVLIQFARQQVIPKLSSFEIEPRPEIQPLGQEPEITEKEEVKVEVKPEIIPEPEVTPEKIIKEIKPEEPDIKNPDFHQLERAKNILEHARKILDQTKKIEIKKTLEKPAEIIQEKKTISPAEPQYEQKDETVQDDEFPTIQFENTPKREEIIINADENIPTTETVSADVEEETIFTEKTVPPQRVTLPTSEKENEYTEENAWSLLKSGSAEEAFYIFSKLIQNFNQRDV